MKPVSVYRWADLPSLAATAASYALLAKTLLTFHSVNGLVTVFWPAAGVALAALLLGGLRYAPAIYLGAVAGQLWAGHALGPAMVISLGSLLEPLFGAWLLARRGNFDTSLRASRDFFQLCVVAAISPVICVSIGIGTLLVLGHLPADGIGHEFAHWWMGDTLGIIVIAPLILVWRQLPQRGAWGTPEAVLMLLAAFLIGQAIFLDWFHDAFGLINRGYWLYLIVAWAAVRLSVHGALLVVLMATLQGLLSATLRIGYFGKDLAATQLTNFWAYTMILAVVGISLALIIAERKRITDQLEASEGRYRSLFENMTHGLAHCRMIFRDGVPVDFEYLAVNPAFAGVSGLQDVVGRTMGSLLPADTEDGGPLLEKFGHIVTTGTAAQWEHHSPARDRWFAITAYRPAAGEFVALIENISERKRGEAELRKLSLAVRQSPVSIVITDRNGRIEYVNPAFTQSSGYSAAEARGQDPRLLQSGRTPRATYVELWTALHAGKAWSGELINRRKDGTDYYETATIAPLRQDDGSISHYVGVKTDISELKRTLGELRTSENRLHLAKVAAGLGIFDRDIRNDRLTWDERTREIWGIGPDEPVSFATFLAGLHPDDRAVTQAAIDGALDPHGNGEFQAEYRVIGARDGRVRHVAANGQVFFDDARPVRIVGTIKDITLKKQWEKEMRERRSEMDLLINQQVAAQTAAAIAHELNQPLVSVSAYSEAALRMQNKGNPQPDKLMRALTGAMEQAQRAGGKLHELLDFLHKGEMPREPLNLNSVVADALIIAEQSGHGDFRPVLQLQEDLPAVLANRLQLQKVLVNLMHNGVEAMRGAGDPTAPLTIGVEMAAAGTMAQVTVQDSGPGIDAETAQRIFEPFFTTKRDGIGLGLAISRALIEAHGGQLWIDPDGGRGATFHFTLPFAS